MNRTHSDLEKAEHKNSLTNGSRDTSPHAVGATPQTDRGASVPTATTPAPLPATGAPPQAVDPPPNGGTVAWLQVVAAFFMWMGSFGVILAYGVFQDFYAENYLRGYSPSNIAWIGTIQGFLVFFFGALSGPLFDKGYLKSMVITGTVLVTLGLMTASAARKYYSIFLSLGLCTGLGTSFLFAPAVAVVGTYFTTKRPLAAGIAASGGGLGSVIFTAIFKPLVDRVGFGWAIRIIAFIILAGLLVACAVIKQRPTPNKPRALIDVNGFKEARFMIILIACFFLFAGTYTPFFYVGVFARTVLGVSQLKAYGMLAVMGAGSIFGRVICPIPALKYGSMPVVAALVFICAMLNFAWGSIHTIGQLSAFALFYGFFGGGVAGVSVLIPVEMSPSINVVGTRIGMTLLFGSVGILVGSPIAGAILNSRGGFEGLQAFSAAVLIVASILIGIAFELMQKFKKQQAAQATA